MTFDERLAAIRANMAEHKLDVLVAIHDGAHFIETPNPVFVLSRFKSLGPAAVVLRRDGEADLIMTPAWDVERAQECCRECCPTLRIIGADDVVDALAATLSDAGAGAAVGLAGVQFTRWEIAGRMAQLLPRGGAPRDHLFRPPPAQPPPPGPQTPP